MLEVRDLAVNYGHINAVKGISLTVQKGEIVALLGANGAGKTTTLLTLTGTLKPAAGSIRFQEEEITGLPPYETVRKGISLVPEGRGIFPHLTVLENLRLGGYQRNDGEALKSDLEECLTLFPVLRERLKQNGGTLSGGEQQMLAIARSLMARPRLLLLDEPSLGLAPKIAKQIFEMILTINQRGTTILLVEQNAFAALRLSGRAYVLETGRIALHDTAENLLNDPRVKSAYLGG
jgi:branched-chain amino acid transport system ATP-binding protein